MELSAPPPLTSSSPVVSESAPVPENQDSPDGSTYGPIRRRVSGKNGPDSLWRPAALQQDDFVEIMREVVPELIQNMTDTADSQSSGSGIKRPLESAATSSADEPPTTKNRVDAVTEVFSVQSLNTQQVSVEVLIAEYIKKKMAKELPHSNNLGVASNTNLGTLFIGCTPGSAHVPCTLKIPSRYCSKHPLDVAKNTPYYVQKHPLLCPKNTP